MKTRNFPLKDVITAGIGIVFDRVTHSISRELTAWVTGNDDYAANCLCKSAILWQFPWLGRIDRKNFGRTLEEACAYLGMLEEKFGVQVPVSPLGLARHSEQPYQADTANSLIKQIKESPAVTISSGPAPNFDRYTVSITGPKDLMKRFLDYLEDGE